MKTLKGKIVSGLGKGKYFMELRQYVEQFEQKLGIKPYPGTLNVKIDLSKLKEFLSDLEPIIIHGFSTDERKFGDVNAYKIKINKINAALIIPEKTRHSKDIIEIIAKERLRDKLNLKDNDEICIEI